MFVSDIDPINFLSTYTVTLLFNMTLCKYNRAPYRFDDEDDSSNDCAEKSAIIRSLLEKGYQDKESLPLCHPCRN